MNHTHYNFNTKDNLSLFARAWLTSQPEPKGIVHLVHGLGEHSGRYDHVGKALNDAGFHLVSFDLRGHGLSQGKKGHAPSFEHFLDDVQVFWNDAKTRFADIENRFLYGHSLGGNIVIQYGLHHPFELSGVIATSPALSLSYQPPKLKLIAAKILSHLLPSLTVKNALDTSALSRDQAVVQAYRDDVYVHDLISTKLSMGLIDSGATALEQAENWTLPLLLMHGTSDQITSHEASQSFKKKAGELVELVLWEDSYHELHNDLDKERVIEKIIFWLNAHSYV